LTASAIQSRSTFPSEGSRAINLQAKNALLTGAASGLGRRLALDLAREEVRLALVDKNAEGLASLAASLSELRAEALPIVADVTREDECRVCVDRTVKSFRRIDLLILCAGISMWAPFEGIDDLSVFRKIMDINYLGAVNCIHPALPFLRESRGMIVSVSSLQGEIGIPHHSGYAASKHALNGLLETLEFEIGDQIHILNILPGWITGTGLRANAFTVGGEERGSRRRHSKESVTVEEASERIVRAIKKDETAVFIPRKLKYLVWLKFVAPRLVRAIIRRAVDKQRT
jgi:NAD(P)-dependent dehydrogenase (short-subunit alcohol dehydrogenase family)